VTNGVYAAGGKAVYHNIGKSDQPGRVGQGADGHERQRFCQHRDTRRVGSGFHQRADGRALRVSDKRSNSDGFTLQGGATLSNTFSSTSGSGGGVWCAGPGAVAANCRITGNSAASYGGGAYSGTLNNCMLTDNRAREGGGAFGYTVSDGTLNNCVLTGNSAPVPAEESVT